MASDPKIHTSEVTPPALYFNRRALMRGGVLAAGAAWQCGAVSPTQPHRDGQDRDGRRGRADQAGRPRLHRGRAEDAIRVGRQLQQLLRVLDGQGRRGRRCRRRSRRPAGRSPSAGWRTSRGCSISTICRRLSPPEERVYRMRCVEAWSMVIPWVGFSLSKLLETVEPMADARYVAFETLLDREADAQPEGETSCRGPTSRACAWTRRCTRSRC